MGYAGIEYAGLHNHDPRDIAHIVSDLGLTACSAHTPMPTRENIDQLAADADALGYRRIITGFGPDKMKDEPAVNACAHAFAAGCETARQVGLTLGMHNHAWEFHDLAGTTPFEIIMTAAGDLFSELDIYWSCHAQVDTQAITKTWANRIPILHVKDGDLTEPPIHKAVGDGKVPIKSIVEAADPSILEWLVVELDDCDTDMLQAVEKSVKWLKASGLGTR